MPPVRRRNHRMNIQNNGPLSRRYKPPRSVLNKFPSMNGRKIAFAFIFCLPSKLLTKTLPHAVTSTQAIPDPVRSTHSIPSSALTTRPSICHPNRRQPTGCAIAPNSYPAHHSAAPQRPAVSSGLGPNRSRNTDDPKVVPFDDASYLCPVTKPDQTDHKHRRNEPKTTSVATALLIASNNVERGTAPPNSGPLGGTL